MRLLMISDFWIFVIVGIVILHFLVGVGLLIYKIYKGDK